MRIKGKGDVAILNEQDLYRLIASQERVKYYNMDLKQVESVMKAYSEIVLSAIHMGIRIPLPQLGNIYLRTSTYNGGASNIKSFEDLKINPSITKKIDFSPKVGLNREITKHYKKYFDSTTLKEFKQTLEEYKKSPTIQEIIDKYTNGELDG